MARVVVSTTDLPLLVPPGREAMSGRHLLEGQEFGLENLTLTLGESPPGQFTRLHRHDAEELIIVHAGRGIYTVGETTVEAGPGDVILIPSGVPHRWVNSGEAPLVHTGVFSTGRFAMGTVHDSPDPSQDSTPGD
jgi:quercetin dioxygenase-like cupin family protein